MWLGSSYNEPKCDLSQRSEMAAVQALCYADVEAVVVLTM